MKVDCLNCGFTYEYKKRQQPTCPKCGSDEYTTMVSLAEDFLKTVKSEKMKIVEVPTNKG